MHACDGALEKRRSATATDGGAPKSLGVLGTGTVVSRATERRRHGTAQVAAGEVGFIRQVKPRREDTYKEENEQQALQEL